MFTCKDVHLDFPTKRIFESVTLGVDEGDRIGIVGRNGDGKSTLLRILSRTMEPDSGQVIPNGTWTVGILGQNDSFSDDDIVDQVLSSEPSYIWAADRRSREIVESLVPGVDPNCRVGNLSGGQRRRLDLARLLIGDWDILMLDEPTNHLDMHAIHWLAEHLKHRWPAGSGALLVVTHDRWFLDEVCQNMWEVHDGLVEPFEGGFSAYILQRVERDRQIAVSEQKRQNQIRRELAFLSRGAQARRSKPKFHLDAAQALIEDVPPLRDSIELKQMAMQRLGKQVVELHDVSVRRGGRDVLSHVDWNVGPGDRIGILGENGIGKSTLLATIDLQLNPTGGYVKVGKTVRFAMLSQNLEELRDVEDDVVRVVIGRRKTHYLVDGKSISGTAMLERLGFSHDDLNARVRDLSGGQRRRLQLLLILMEEPNVLILDEPGNDMDTDMLAVTEDLLDSWPGTLLMVSHDRYFIERVTDDQFAVIDGQIRHVPGGVDEYLRLLDARDYGEKSSPKGAPDAITSNGNGATRTTGADAYKLRKHLVSTERKMETQQTRIDEAKEALAAADPYDFNQLASRQADLDTAEGVLTELEETWLRISEQLEG